MNSPEFDRGERDDNAVTLSALSVSISEMKTPLWPE